MEDVRNEPELGGEVLIGSGRNRKELHKTRRILAQVLATVAVSLLVLDLGMMIAVPTIVIGELHNAKEGLSLDDYQASWFSSVLLLCQPVGSVLSGCLQAPLGRKWTMVLVTVPHAVSWYLLHSAQSAAMLYVASASMGVGIGFLEAPLLAYIGEITEPKLRGRLATYSNANAVLGHLLEFGLGCLLPWRLVMLVSCAVPAVAFAALCMVNASFALTCACVCVCAPL
uniref:Facilitated trehalose transporter Tret1 n=1 Tax=Sipha flava TaxID=143950 RepID=A0A2S2QAJ7_9HEMI